MPKLFELKNESKLNFRIKNELINNETLNF